jgi:hypothetical protein
MFNIIGFDFRSCDEREAIKVHWKDRSTLFCGQSLELDVHLFEDRESMYNY